MGVISNFTVPNTGADIVDSILGLGIVCSIKCYESDQAAGRTILKAQPISDILGRFNFGAWPSGKALDSGSRDRRFESYRPSHTARSCQ